jgi:hypothetical protein
MRPAARCGAHLSSVDRPAAQPVEHNRHPGNGRFTGFGTIRMYAPNHIHVSLRQPVILNRVCRSADEVYNLLRRLKLKGAAQ